MSMVSLEEVKDIVEKFEVGYNKVSPHFVPKILSNMAAGLVSMQFGIKVCLKLLLHRYRYYLFINRLIVERWNDRPRDSTTP